MTLSRRGFLAGAAAIVAAGPSAVRVLASKSAPTTVVLPPAEAGYIYLASNPGPESVWIDAVFEARRFARLYGGGISKMRPPPHVLGPGESMSLADYGELEARTVARRDETRQKETKT